MKKLLFLLCLFFVGKAVAQETIMLPSTFDENKMIVKKLDANGNYIPIDQMGDTELKQPVSTFNINNNIPKGDVAPVQETVPQAEATAQQDKVPDWVKQAVKEKEENRLAQQQEVPERIKQAIKADEEKQAAQQQVPEHIKQAIEENEAKQAEKAEEERQAQQKRVRRLRAVEKDYGLPKTSFDATTLEEINVPENSTFQHPTLTKEMDKFRRDNTIFEECKEGDQDCQTYEIDEKGQVIF